MKTNENLQKVALVFFVMLGLGHILSGLMIGNGYFMPFSLIINHILDIPFALSALIYGFSGIYKNTKPERQKTMGTFFIIITLLIFIGLVYINVFVPDKIFLTTPS